MVSPKLRCARAILFSILYTSNWLLWWHKWAFIAQPWRVITFIIEGNKWLLKVLWIRWRWKSNLSQRNCYCSPQCKTQREISWATTEAPQALTRGHLCIRVQAAGSLGLEVQHIGPKWPLGKYCNISEFQFPAFRMEPLPTYFAGHQRGQMD